MKIKFDNIPMLVSSEEFRKDVNDLLFLDIPKIKDREKLKKEFEDRVQKALFFIGVAICADEKGMLKVDLKKMADFMNDKKEYLVEILKRIVDSKEVEKRFKVKLEL